MVSGLSPTIDLYVVRTLHCSLHVGIVFYCKRVLSMRPGVGKLVFAGRHSYRQVTWEQRHPSFLRSLVQRRLAKPGSWANLLDQWQWPKRLRAVTSYCHVPSLGGIFHKEVVQTWLLRQSLREAPQLQNTPQATRQWFVNISTTGTETQSLAHDRFSINVWWMSVMSHNLRSTKSDQPTRCVAFN